MTFEEFLDAILDDVEKDSAKSEDEFVNAVAGVSAFYIDELVRISNRYSKDANETVRVALAVNSLAAADFDFTHEKDSKRVNTFGGMKQ